MSQVQDVVPIGHISCHCLRCQLQRTREALRELLTDYESGACTEFPNQLNSADKARTILKVGI